MLTSIGSATLAPATQAQAAKPRPAEPTPPAQDVASEDTTTDSTVETQSSLSSATARVGGQLQAQAAASRVGSATSADYIAEADTNSDKTVSDQERAAYEKKLAQQVEAKAAATDRSRELQAAYGLSEDAAPSLAVTA